MFCLKECRISACKTIASLYFHNHSLLPVIYDVKPTVLTWLWQWALCALWLPTEPNLNYLLVQEDEQRDVENKIQMLKVVVVFWKDRTSIEFQLLFTNTKIQVYEAGGAAMFMKETHSASQLLFLPPNNNLQLSPLRIFTWGYQEIYPQTLNISHMSHRDKEPNEPPLWGWSV